MYFPATITDGKLTFNGYVKQKFDEWAQSHEGARISVDVRKPTRSTTQNSYYWLYLGIVERETGQLATDVHEWAKRKFLPPKFITVQGQEMKIPATTTELDKTAFGEYIDKVAAEIGIALPNPADAGYISNY